MAFASTELYQLLVDWTGNQEWVVHWTKEDGYTAWCGKLRLSRQRTFGKAVAAWEKEIAKYI